MPRSEKLGAYLELAGEVRSLANNLANDLSRRLQADEQAVAFRDRLLIGLAVKMYNSFECLRNDAEDKRLEAMHHLKTLVETFIYFRWAAKDTGDSSARLVYARTINETIHFNKKNPGYAPKAILREWVKQLATATHGLESRWQKFKDRTIRQLARDIGIDLEKWYNRIYRLACGPAHIGDLMEHMPGPDGEIHLNKTPTSRLRSEIALDYGLHIMWDLLKIASDYLDLRLKERISMLQTRHNALRSVRIM